MSVFICRWFDSSRDVARLSDSLHTVQVLRTHSHGRLFTILAVRNPLNLIMNESQRRLVKKPHENRFCTQVTLHDMHVCINNNFFFCSEPSNFRSVNQCTSLLPVPQQSLATSQRLFIFNMAEQEGF